MPEGAPLPKVEATRGYGADVVFHGQHRRRCARCARGVRPDEHGAVLIHPFDHPDIVAGQGTLGLEILEQCPEVRDDRRPGRRRRADRRASRSRSRRSDPGIRVVGVQAEAVAAYPVSLAAGHPVPVEPVPTMADGIAVGLPGDFTFGDRRGARRARC